MSFLVLSLVALQSAAEVRQIVSFRFLPGKTSEAIQVFRDEARPLEAELEGWIAESRQVILAPVRELSVR